VATRDANNQDWYPGVEFLGEGIFLSAFDANGQPLSARGEAATHWNQAWREAGNLNYPAHLFRTTTNRDELCPMFVWWHSFSHMLMRAISVDAGYSSAALRERVYLECDNSIGNAEGGVILYATQPGSEGTLGGMIALVPHFERIIRRVADLAQACSNDPLCIENIFATGDYSGPACYGCLLASETSCEHRNLWLDRQVLLDRLG
jgi:hypothetical protein